MRPLRLDLEGFLSFRDPTGVALGEHTAVAIVGENGAGKTTLVEAIGWALYGRGRGRGPDDYITAGASACHVEFTFALEGTDYVVVRARDRGAKSYLGLFSIEPGADVRRPIGGDSIAETQSAIDELLGMSGDLWEATSYIGQGKADAFTSMRPSERIALLSELLELDRYAGFAEVSRAAARGLADHQASRRSTLEQLEEEAGDLGTYEVARADHRVKIDRARSDAEAIEADIAAITESMRAGRERRRDLDLWTEEVEVLRAARDRSAREIDQEAAQLEADIRATEHAWTTETDAIARLQAATSAGEQALEALGPAGGALAVADGDLVAAEQLALDAAGAVAGARDRLGMAEAARDALSARIDRLQAHAGEQTCPECGQDLDEDARAFMIQALGSEAAGQGIALRALEGSLAVALEDAGRMHGRITALRGAAAAARGEVDRLQRTAERRPTAKDYAAAHFRLADAEGRLQALRDRRAKMDERRLEARDPGERERELLQRIAEAQEIEDIRGQLQEGLDRQNLQLEETRAAIDQHLQRLGRAETLLERATKARDQAATVAEEVAAIGAALERELLLEDAFGTWIPKATIELALPDLEDHANALLGRLTGGRFSVRIDSLKALKGGGMRESLELLVADDVSDRPIEALSGGERQCVDLALRIALARLLAHRAGRRIETLIIDEGFTALDQAHRQRTIEVLHGLVEEFPSLVFVTHLQDLAEAFPAQIQLGRREGTSCILEGAAA